MSDACEACLRRSHLIAFLAGDVQRFAAASEATLLAALPRPRRLEAHRYVRAFDAAAARERVAAASLEAVCRHAPSYPAGLRDLAQPPSVVYTTSLERLVVSQREPAAVVVGTRRPSEYGRTIGYELGRGLGAARVPVVSGLALGIDAAAQRGALDAGGLSVAVLAGGADVPYPRSNRALYERLRETGAIVSELPPGVQPLRWLFPPRNRIMAALGRVTVVVEAAARSGTLITAGFASELGRDVAAVPGWVTARSAAGTNGLLREGAALVAGAQDVLDLLYGVGARDVPAETPPELDPQQARVLELVCAGARLEQLAADTGLAPQAVRATLGRLEAAGLVRRGPTGAYGPSGRSARILPCPCP